MDTLCGVDRPDSILTWKRSPRVQALLTGLAGGDIPLTHDGLDEAGTDKQVTHLRSLLEHNGLLAARDEPLARFERWLAPNLRRSPSRPCAPPSNNSPPGITCAGYARTRRPGKAPMAAARYAKQEITETIKFLTWLHSTHHRTAATCRQQDVDEWLASGPTTRSKVRNLLAWAKKARVNKSVQHHSPAASSQPRAHPGAASGMAQELLNGDSETLAYRVAGILLLLFAQPLTKIAALPTSAITRRGNDVRISLGKNRSRYRNRSQTCSPPTSAAGPTSEPPAEMATSPWLFPERPVPAGTSTRNVIMERLGRLGIDLLGARNTALQSLVVEAPPPLVAELLGYSYNTTQRHAEIAAQPWARYVTKTAAESN